jgi:hypothetical protein
MILGETYYIFDNIIDFKSQNILEEYCKLDYKNWKFFKKSPTDLTNELFPDFDFPFYTKDIKNVDSSFFNKDVPESIDNIIESIKLNALEKSNLKLLKTYRYKLNCMAPIKPCTDNELWRLIHIDENSQHIVLLYYINDIDGDTCLFRNKRGITMDAFYTTQLETERGNYENVELITRISPKKGRVIIFDGSLLHSPGYSFTGNRFGVNYNIMIETKHSKNLI